jgi:hypothetical protein
LNFDGGGAGACCCAEALPIPAKTKAERTASERIGFILCIVFSLIRLSFLAVNGGRRNKVSPMCQTPRRTMLPRPAICEATIPEEVCNASRNYLSFCPSLRTLLAVDSNYRDGLR